MKKYALPIGLLGHSAIVINDSKGSPHIHVFGGMWGKLSNFKGYGFYKGKQDRAQATQFRVNTSVHIEQNTHFKSLI